MYKDFHPNPLHHGNLVDRDSINQSIKNILTTRKGTMPGKPDFGCNLDDYLFEQIDHILVQSMQRDIKISLSKYEPRIDVISVDIFSHVEYNRIAIQINYKFNFIQTDPQVYELILN